MVCGAEDNILLRVLSGNAVKIEILFSDSALISVATKNPWYMRHMKPCITGEMAEQSGTCRLAGSQGRDFPPALSWLIFANETIPGNNLVAPYKHL